MLFKMLYQDKLYWLSKYFFSIKRLNILTLRNYMNLPCPDVDWPGRGGDNSLGVLGGLNKPHTLSNSSVMLVYSECIATSSPLGLAWGAGLDGGITLIFGSAKVTLLSTVPARTGRKTVCSLLSGSDWVCEICLRVKLLLLSCNDSPLNIWKHVVPIMFLCKIIITIRTSSTCGISSFSSRSSPQSPSSC